MPCSVVGVARESEANLAHQGSRSEAMEEEMPINPKLIIWARERAGMTVEEVTEKFPDIVPWEAGTSFPTYPQLERLADEFNLPVAAFFLPKPPTLPPMVVFDKPTARQMADFFASLPPDTPFRIDANSGLVIDVFDIAVDHDNVAWLAPYYSDPR